MASDGADEAHQAHVARVERRCWKAGERLVCGIDEVGRGAWAGPATVAAVIPPDRHLRGVRDSKMLTRAQREDAARAVRRWAVAIGVGHASHEECDELGMTARCATPGTGRSRSSPSRASSPTG